MHTASYFGYHHIIKDLFLLRVDINLQDYKGATPLHRAKNHETMLVGLGENCPIDDNVDNNLLAIFIFGIFSY